MAIKETILNTNCSYPMFKDYIILDLFILYNTSKILYSKMYTCQKMPENIHMPFYYSLRFKEKIVKSRINWALDIICKNMLWNNCAAIWQILFCSIDNYYDIVKYNQPPMHHESWTYYVISINTINIIKRRMIEKIVIK